MAKKDTTTSSETWNQRYDLAVRTQERMFQKFGTWYDTMYAHIKTDQYALWRSKVFLPLLPSKAWSMIAKMTQYKPGFEVSLYGDALLDESMQERAQKAQTKLEHDWHNPMFDEGMSEKLFSPLVDAVVTGTGIAKVPWQYGQHTRYEKQVDPNTGQADPATDVKIQESGGYNDLIPHDIMATYIAPGAKNLYSAPWVILEDWVTVAQLEEENASAGVDLYDPKALEQAKDIKVDPDRFAQQKRSRQMLNNNEDPITADQTYNQFKRIECYERSTMMLYVYAVGGNDEQGLIELAKRKLPFWHGKYPLVAFYVKRRPHNFWGQGIFEDTERLQSAFNDVFNHYMDNLNLSLDGMILKQEGEDYTYIVEPGGEFLYKSNKPEQFKFPDPNPNQFRTVMDFLESQTEEATISRYATGTPNSSTDKTSGTASGIMKLTEMAGDKIGFMRQNFAASLREIGRQWLSNNQQFLDSPVTIMGTEKGQQKPVTISPTDLQGQMMLRIDDASMEPPSKSELIQQFQLFSESVQKLQAASFIQAQQSQGAVKPLFVDYGTLVADLGNKLGQAGADKIVLTEEDMAQRMAQMPPQAPQQPPVDPLAIHAAGLKEQQQTADQAQQAERLRMEAEKHQLAMAQGIKQLVTPDQNGQ